MATKKADLAICREPDKLLNLLYLDDAVVPDRSIGTVCSTVTDRSTASISGTADFGCAQSR